MNQATHNSIVSFIWGIADDVLRDVYVRGHYRNVILPMTVIRRLDSVLEPTKQEVLARKQQLDKDRIVQEENLKPEETKSFVHDVFQDGSIPTTGTTITKILPPISRFAEGNPYAIKKRTVLEKLSVLFERYFGLG